MRTLTPLRADQIVALAYEYADALQKAERVANDLWHHLPPERRAAFDAVDIDTSTAEQAIRAAADAWQEELDAL